MKKISLLIAAILFVLAANAQIKWTVDFAHSSIKFSVTHMLISEVEGTFKTYTGSVVSPSADFTDALVDFSVDVKSINTDNEMRDNHLKSADFFDTDKYPQMTFKSKSFKKLTGNKYELTGDLTLHGVTKPVKFEVTYGGSVKDPWGNTKAGFKATSVINRFDYGLKWNSLTEAGGAVVGQDVEIQVKLELTQVK